MLEFPTNRLCLFPVIIDHSKLFMWQLWIPIPAHIHMLMAEIISAFRHLSKILKYHLSGQHNIRWIQQPRGSLTHLIISLLILGVLLKLCIDLLNSWHSCVRGQRSKVRRRRDSLSNLTESHLSHYRSLILIFLFFQSIFKLVLT